jgi:hypothetical protein
MNCAQPQEPLERVVVAIAVKEGMPFSNAKRSNPTIDCLADSVPTPPKRPEVASRGNRHIRTSGFEYLEAAQFALDFGEGEFVRDSLQDLAENQVGQAETLPVKLQI